MVHQKHVLGARGYGHHWREVARQPVAAERRGAERERERRDYRTEMG